MMNKKTAGEADTHTNDHTTCTFVYILGKCLEEASEKKRGTDNNSVAIPSFSQSESEVSGVCASVCVMVQ